MLLGGCIDGCQACADCHLKCVLIRSNCCHFVFSVGLGSCYAAAALDHSLRKSDSEKACWRVPNCIDTYNNIFADHL